MSIVRTAVWRMWYICSGMVHKVIPSIGILCNSFVFWFWFQWVRIVYGITICGEVAWILGGVQQSETNWFFIWWVHSCIHRWSSSFVIMVMWVANDVYVGVCGIKWDDLIFPGVWRFCTRIISKQNFLVNGSKQGWLTLLTTHFDLEGCDPKGTGVAIEWAPLLRTTPRSHPSSFSLLIESL